MERQLYCVSNTLSPADGTRVWRDAKSPRDFSTFHLVHHLEEMNSVEESNQLARIGKRSLAVIAVLMLVTVLIPVGVRAAVSDYWAAKDVDVRLEPAYRDISYTLDPIEVVQRFDAKGVWYWPTTTTINDSMLILGPGATNASLGVTRDPNLNDGTYFECRVKATAASNFTMSLTTANGNTTKIFLSHNQKVFGTYNGSITRTTGSLMTWVAGTWAKLGIEFGAQTVFYAIYDNGTVAGHVAATAPNMTHAQIVKLELKQTVALKTAEVDWFVSTTVRTALAPVSPTSRALVVPADEKVTRRNIAYTLDDVQDILTLSNNTGVENAIGYTPTGKDISNDNKLNETDLGHILIETPEDTSAGFAGKAVIKGWDSTRDATDQSIETYLAERHQVPKAYVIDYYIRSMDVNISVSQGLADKIEKSAIQNFMGQVKDKGGEINYVDNSGLMRRWNDYDFAYIPRDVTSEKWTQMKEDLSNAIRAKTVSMVVLTQQRPGDITEPMIKSPFSMALPLAGSLNLGPSYQETNALIGSVLVGNDYTPVDAAAMDTQMAAGNQSDFRVLDDGKASVAGFSLVTVFGTWTMWILAISVIVISAVVIMIFVMKRKHHRKTKK